MSPTCASTLATSVSMYIVESIQNLKMHKEIIFAIRRKFHVVLMQLAFFQGLENVNSHKQF